MGFIEALHGKFCSSCNRLRLTSEGFLKPCLYYRRGVDLKALLRGGAGEKELEEMCIRDRISDYLQYELGLCHIMQRINLSLVGTVDLDIGDFKDIIKW